MPSMFFFFFFYLSLALRVNVRLGSTSRREESPFKKHKDPPKSIHGGGQGNWMSQHDRSFCISQNFTRTLRGILETVFEAQADLFLLKLINDALTKYVWLCRHKLK